MATHPSRPVNRRRRIIATVAAVAVIGMAGGYGTYAAFSDTTELTGSATAGTVQLNDQGADTRSFTVTGLLPGDAPSVCFDVAAPSSGNTQGLDVTLTAERTTNAPSAADTALAGVLTVGLESVPVAGEDFVTQNGVSSSGRTVLRTDRCDTAAFNPDGGTVVPVAPQTVVNIAALGAAHGTQALTAGTKRRYRVTVTLPAGATDAAQGGTATFSLTWKGTAKTA